MPTTTKLRTFDIRFTTSSMFAGSDAMNADHDYSLAYLVSKQAIANSRTNKNSQWQLHVAATIRLERGDGHGQH